VAGDGGGAERPPRHRVRAGAARSRRAAARSAHAAGHGARAAGHGARAAGRSARAGARRVRRATNAQGAGETGLGRLIELHGVNVAGDALVAVALAGTLFFQVPVGEARGRVALYLLLTMAPFALLAPVVGPVLDRLGAGRRWALCATFVLRAFLALVMAGAVTGAGQDDALRLYPAAFAALVLSRAYGVTRATITPRLLPAGIGLVSANGRAQLAGTVAGSVAAVLGAGLAAVAGPGPVLWACAGVLALGAVASLRLPRTADSAAGEVRARMSGEPDPHPHRHRWSVGRPVVRALRANAALRAFSGFLTLFLAFLLRREPVGPFPTAVTLGLVIGAAAVGSTAGTAAGTLLRERRPEATVLAVVCGVAAAAGIGAWLYGGVAVLMGVALAAGCAQSLGKLSLDAIVQREVPERVRSSAFARTETVLQLSWVCGGLLGILLPLSGAAGLLVATGGLTGAAVLTGRGSDRGAPRPEAAG
jgi:Major Facilitator Superfamily